jgi:predicted regulator of Ras-like GTPase activity (Roadblock/LC7/MglB family)
MLRSQNEVLEHLIAMVNNNPEIQGCVAVQTDTVSIYAAALPAGLSQRHVAAMATTALSLGEKLAMDVNIFHPAEIVIQQGGAYIIVTPLSHNTVLLTLTTPGARLGFVRHDMKQVSRALVM